MEHRALQAWLAPSVCLMLSLGLLATQIPAAGAQRDAVTGLSTTPDWMVDGNQTDASLGIWVSTAGDVNGDGYDDIIAGAHRYTGGETEEGKAFVYHGSVDGLDTTPDWTAEGNQEGANFGRSVSTAGDVDGDGYDDVIVGAYYYDGEEADAGAAFVYCGSAEGLSATPDWTVEGKQAGAGLGASVCSAGDVNGDGYDDVIVGVPGYDIDATGEGKASVYFGSEEGLGLTPDWTAEGDQAGANFGWAACQAGDVNGDGYDDIIVGAPNHDSPLIDSGSAFVYLGSPDGPSDTAAWTANGGQAGEKLGYAVAMAGDVDGDGYDDVAVGAHRYNSITGDEGRTLVYYGSASGPSSTPDWTAEGEQEDGTFGMSLGTAGDVNGDGYDDLIVGAPWYQQVLSTAAAYAYHGSETGLDSTPDWSVTVDQNLCHFGRSVSTAGDVNGDGTADVIVGAHLYNHNFGDEGRVYMYHGSPVPISGLEAENDSPTRLGTQTVFTATISAGTLVSYTWSFGDGTPGSGAMMTHIYPAAGAYTAVVTASNSASWLTATTTVAVRNTAYLPLVLR